MKKFVYLIAYVCALTDEQRERYTKDFNIFDENKDGFIDPTEVRTTFANLGPQEVSSFFIAVDFNEDGLITLQEYLDGSLANEQGAMDLNDFR